MTFTNTQVDLETLPRFDAVRFRRPDERYRFLVLGLWVAFELPMLLGASVIALANPAARSALTTVPGVTASLGALVLAALAAWYAYESASVIRFAVREHDVILRSGVFWKRETIQPVKRIQHVEQMQGPVARRFGLAKIRLFSAGTAHFAFEIPGLDAATAARMRQSILTLRESRVGEARATAAPDAPADTAPAQIGDAGPDGA